MLNKIKVNFSNYKLTRYGKRKVLKKHVLSFLKNLYLFGRGDFFVTHKRHKQILHNAESKQTIIEVLLS